MCFQSATRFHGTCVHVSLLSPIVPFPTHMFAQPVSCAQLLPHIAPRSHCTESTHCTHLHLTHSGSSTYRSAVLRRTTAQRNYVEMNCYTEFHPDRPRNTEVNDSERIFMKLTLDRQGCVKNSCSEFRENMVGRTVAGTRSRSTWSALKLIVRRISIVDKTV